MGVIPSRYAPETQDVPPAFPDPDEDDDDRAWKARRQRRIIVAAVVAALVAVVGALALYLAKSASPVSQVRYLNDTGRRVIVTPCGESSRCVIAAGASVVRKPPQGTNAPNNEPVPRVTDARTHRIVGCIVYRTGERTVRISEAAISGFC